MRGPILPEFRVNRGGIQYDPGRAATVRPTRAAEVVSPTGATAHVVVKLTPEDGHWYTTTKVVAVYLDADQARRCAQDLNREHGFEFDEDGEAWGEQFAVRTVPLIPKGEGWR